MNPPELAGGGLERILEIVIGSPLFLGQRGIYRRRGDARRWPGPPGGVHARPGGGPRLEVTWTVRGSPPSVLRVPSSFHIKNNSRKFCAQSEKLSRTTFLKQKQELALGILLIG